MLKFQLKIHQNHPWENENVQFSLDTLFRFPINVLHGHISLVQGKLDASLPILLHMSSSEGRKC